MDTTATPVESRLVTGEELYKMGDLGPSELIDGRIVPMSPTGGTHGRVEVRVSSSLDRFVREQELGWVVGGEAGVYTRRNPDRVRGVDAAFLSKQRLPQGLPDGYIEVAPELIVEIMSPGDSWQEVWEKLEEYFAIGVEQVWIVQPRNRIVLVFRSLTDVQRLGIGDVLAGEGALGGFTLPIADLFE